eukprot:532634-Amphidinium_carterae.1
MSQVTQPVLHQRTTTGQDSWAHPEIATVTAPPSVDPEVLELAAPAEEVLFSADHQTHCTLKHTILETLIQILLLAVTYMFLEQSKPI